MDKLNMAHTALIKQLILLQLMQSTLPVAIAKVGLVVTT